MPENPRAPATPPTVRIARPYGSEDEFVEGDFAWLGRATIVLPHAPARPAGELIRFEIVLATGSPVFRGEGQVVGHHAPGSGKPPGLEVRFSRIDARSKAILDRVRMRRTGSPAGKSGASGASLAPPAASVSLAPPVASVSLAPPVASPSLVPPVVSALPAPALPVLRPPLDRPSERSGVHKTKAGKVDPPPNRDDILARLRERAQSLTANGGFAFKKR